MSELKSRAEVISVNSGAETKRVAKPVAKAKISRQNRGKQILNTFITDDLDHVKDYLIFDVMVPAVKNAIVDTVVNGIELLIFGETKGSGRKKSSPTGYTTYFKGPSVVSSSYATKYEQQTISPRANRYNPNEIILGTRAEAEEVLDSLIDIVDQYNVASVGDLYDLVGVTGSYTDQSWGWEDLTGAGIQRVREGYLIKLPKPIDIRR